MRPIAFLQCGTKPEIYNELGGRSCLTVPSVTDEELRAAVSVMDAAQLDVLCVMDRGKRLNILAAAAVAQGNTRATAAGVKENIHVTVVADRVVTELHG